MTQKVLDSPMDRRTRASDLPRDITPAILRIERKVLSLLEAHDESFRDLDPEIWQTSYSLKKHSIEVCEKHVLVGELRGLKGENLARRRLEGIMHDTGKTNPICHLYRRKKVLTHFEKELVDVHASLSAMMMLEEQLGVRKDEDSIFIVSAYAPICFHHMPRVISEPEVRMEAIDLRLVDAVQGWTEHRHRPGINISDAFDKVNAWIETTIVPVGFEHLRPEYEESFEFVRKAFSF